MHSCSYDECAQLFDAPSASCDCRSWAAHLVHMLMTSSSYYSSRTFNSKGGVWHSMGFKDRRPRSVCAQPHIIAVAIADASLQLHTSTRRTTVRVCRIFATTFRLLLNEVHCATYSISHFGAATCYHFAWQLYPAAHANACNFYASYGQRMHAQNKKACQRVPCADRECMYIYIRVRVDHLFADPRMSVADAWLVKARPVPRIAWSTLLHTEV